MSLTAKNSLVGNINNRCKLVGNITTGGSSTITPDYYTGSYEINPSAELQVLPTKDKVMVNDLIIKPIPYAEIEESILGGEW